MILKTLNQLPSEDMSEAFKTCCGSSKWVWQMRRKAPFENLEVLLKSAEEIWYNHCSEKDWQEAFNHHPKIGEHSQSNITFGKPQKRSGEEQAGVNTASQSILDKLKQGNQAYQDKYGFRFISCTNNKSAEDLLNLLEIRLENEIEEELKIARDEQHKITILRLQELLDL